MSTRKIRLPFILVLAIFLMSLQVPEGWFVAGSAPASYEMGSAFKSGMNGSNSATIRSVVDSIDGFGTLMQTSNSEEYWGKRIRLTGYIKSLNVKDWAGLWLRVDNKEKFNTSLAFDNMSDRPINGTSDWTKCVIVLDVPKFAGKLAYGALLDGTGQIWFDDLKFEIVPDTTRLTGKREIISLPRNLDFEK